MNNGSKIIIIEDEKSGINDFSKVLCLRLHKSEQEQNKSEKKWKAISQLMPKPQTNTEVNEKDKKEYYFNEFNKFWNGNAECPTSFKNAYELIESIGSGEDYEWIFIDRNLEFYHDIDDVCKEKNPDIKIGEKKFTKSFFEGIKKYVGDYLFIMLINAGVPIEKICFLTANSNNTIEELKESLYLHKEQIPQIIAKDDDGYENLKKILQNSHCAKIRFLYREIFNNKKVEDIFGPYIEDFITMLAERYKNGQVTFERKNGIVLRNMIEAVVAYISEKYFNIPDLRCRDLLNNKIKYNIKFNKELDLNLIPYSFNYVKQNNFPTQNDQSKIENFLSRQKYYKNNQKKIPQDAEKIINISESLKISSILIQLSTLYRAKIENLPPKYIFSYIDNIYTVTSEISAHGKNDKTTEGLCADGWSALLSGMIQIMQWVADTNPNKSSSAN